MIDAAAVGEILAQYDKHGWKLRRALLSPDSKSVFSNFDADVELVDSDFDALWFSRRSNPESEAWELRRVTGAPFALVVVVSAEDDGEELEAALAHIEDEMRERILA